MHVHEVEPTLARHVVYRDRQGQRIRRVLDQRVVFHLDFVEVDPVLEAREAEGRRVRHEMDFVPPAGEPVRGLGAVVQQPALRAELHQHDVEWLQRTAPVMTAI